VTDESTATFYCTEPTGELLALVNSKSATALAFYYEMPESSETNSTGEGESAEPEAEKETSSPAPEPVEEAAEPEDEQIPAGSISNQDEVI